MFAVSNLGLNMPGQQKAQGYFTSVGTSFGFGERTDEQSNNKTVVPGVGTYNVTRDGNDNDAPAWK
jgi:hypothetical protein